MSIREDLTRLVELQAAEIERRKLEAELASLPAERDRLRERNAAAERAVKKAEAERDDSLKDRRKLEGELQTAEAQVDKYRDQEMQVRRNEELWAIQKEIAAVQDRIGTIEERILEQMEAGDRAGDRIRHTKQEGERIAGEVKAAIAQVDERQKDVEGRLESTRAEIARIRQETDDDALTVYDRVSGVRDGIGIAEMVDGGCAACQVRQRPQLALEVVKMGELRQCENCKRILFARDALQLPSDVGVAGE